MSGETVLLVTASYDTACEYVQSALTRTGIPYFRLDTDRFPSEIQATFDPQDTVTISDGSRVISGNEVKSVWYRRHVTPNLPAGLDPGVRDFCEREARAFLDGALATLPTPHWMSPREAITRAERKPFQLHLAAQLGFSLPSTLMTNHVHAVRRFTQKSKLVAKAVSAGYIKGPSGNQAIFTSALVETDFEDLAGLALAPVTFQEHVEKLSDIRVTVVGDDVFAAEILSQGRDSSRIDWRATDDPDLPHRRHHLPADIKRRCQEFASRLDLVFGAIDLALKPDGTYVFFEINPNGEWLWIEEQLGFPISGRIASWLSSHG